MRPAPLAFGLVALPALCACAATPPPRPAPPTGQSYGDAVAMMCDVDRLAGLSADAEILAVGSKRSAWLAEKVENPDAIELATRLSVKGPDDQARRLRDEAREAGLARCELADSLEKYGTGGLSP